ncbi:MAG: RICIN domain-containing protein [Firmicutes bacterium]|nr:RICIN domain-containing protein [Bacillota bacterium]
MKQTSWKRIVLCLVLAFCVAFTGFGVDSASAASATLKITKQPVSKTVSKNATAKISCSAKGKGLKYNWYYKDKDDKKYTKSKKYKSNTYSVKMTSSVSGRKVYCVIKDKYGKSVKTKVVTLSMKKTTATLSPGVYTFRNSKTGTYLSYKDRTLKLSKTAKKWHLKDVGDKTNYVYALNTELLLDIDNAYVAEGTTIKLWDRTGYNVQQWKVVKNSNGTYSFISAANSNYCLGFKNGKAVLQKRKSGNKYQEWKVTNKTSDVYKSIVSDGKVIELQLPKDITEVISTKRLKKWANDLETAYKTFYDLTNYKPFSNIVVEAYKNCPHIGYVNGTNIIYIDKDFIREDLAKMASRENDWNFCALHEMGHIFDYNRPWNFEAEVMTDLKVAYVLEKNGAQAAPSEFDAATVFTGGGIAEAYDYLGGDISQRYDIYGFAFKFLQIKDEIGWKAFRSTFRDMQKNRAAYEGATNVQKLESFISLLSSYSGKNVRNHFSAAEWNNVISYIR